MTSTDMERSFIMYVSSLQAGLTAGLSLVMQHNITFINSSVIAQNIFYMSIEEQEEMP